MSALVKIPIITTIGGSNLTATNALNITTHDLDVHAPTDTTTFKSDSKDLTASVGVNVCQAERTGVTLRIQK